MRHSERLDRQHRRAVRGGIAVSVAVHAAVLAWVWSAGDGAKSPSTVAAAERTAANQEETFAALAVPVRHGMQVVALREAPSSPAEPDVPRQPPPPVTTAAAEPAASVAEAGQASADAPAAVDLAAVTETAEAPAPEQLAIEVEEVVDAIPAGEVSWAASPASVTDMLASLADAVLTASWATDGANGEQPADDEVEADGIGNGETTAEVHTPGSVASAKSRWIGGSSERLPGGGRIQVRIGKGPCRIQIDPNSTAPPNRSGDPDGWTAPARSCAG